MPPHTTRRFAGPALVCLLLVHAACGAPAGPSQPPPPPPPPPPPAAPASLTAVAGMGQAAPAGTALGSPVTVVVADRDGQLLGGRPVQFTVTSGGGWTVDEQVVTQSDGRATTIWYLGPSPGATQQLQATVGTLSALVSATATSLVSGTTYLGHLGFIEFIAGDGSVVLSAAHGGSLTPPEIPDRTVGTTVTDANTDPLARAMATALHTETGERPHLVIVRLRRTKLDANREVIEAAQGNPLAVRAWREYHGFIEAAKVAAAAAGPRPFYLDIHGHGHAIQRLELGYLLAANDFSKPDAELNSGPYASQSSIRSLATASSTPFAELLRGPTSLGGRFATEGYPSVPSPAIPSPGADPYFNGGYSTARHGSRSGGPVNGVQLEANFTGVRDTDANRQLFAAAAARVIAGFLAGGQQ
ncbi:MAG: hypothetical protein ABR551_03450 [Gemmatimonadales bacterium]